MEENVLKDFETFSEFPDKYLKVNNSSNYYFIRKSNDNFVTKRNIDSISIINIFSNQKLLLVKSYYDVNNGELVLNTRSISNIDRSNEEFIELENNVSIIPLNSILNIKGNNEYYLSKDDINHLINYENKNNNKIKRKV